MATSAAAWWGDGIKNCLYRRYGRLMVCTPHIKQVFVIEEAIAASARRCMSRRHDGAHFAGCGCGEEHRDVVAGDGVNEGGLHPFAPDRNRLSC